MNTSNKPEIVSKNKSLVASQLVNSKRFTELNPTNNYNECDCIYINTPKRTFWYTTRYLANQTLALDN